MSEENKLTESEVINAPGAETEEDWLDQSKACNVEDGECEACQ